MCSLEQNCFLKNSRQRQLIYRDFSYFLPVLHSCCEEGNLLWLNSFNSWYFVVFCQHNAAPGDCVLATERASVLLLQSNTSDQTTAVFWNHHGPSPRHTSKYTNPKRIWTRVTGATGTSLSFYTQENYMWFHTMWTSACTTFSLRTCTSVNWNIPTKKMLFR